MFWRCYPGIGCRRVGVCVLGEWIISRNEFFRNATDTNWNEMDGWVEVEPFI